MNIRIALAGLAALVALALSPSAAQAAASDDAFQQRLFGRVVSKGPIHACFRRAYDAGHLAGHPLQNVRTMLLLVTGKPPEAGAAPTYQLGLDVTFRKNGSHYANDGQCGANWDEKKPGETPPAVHCGIDCDGGSMDISLTGQSSILIAIPDRARLEGVSSDESTANRDKDRFGPDDKLFRLDKARLTDCLPLADADEKRALRHGD